MTFNGEFHMRKKLATIILVLALFSLFPITAVQAGDKRGFREHGRGFRSSVMMIVGEIGREDIMRSANASVDLQKEESGGTVPHLMIQKWLPQRFDLISLIP
jgi:hypothetical protein